MGALILLFFIFVITVIVILFFSPDITEQEESFKTNVQNLWGVIKICQTASFGQPMLKLRPAKRSVNMDLIFLDDEMVSADLPLRLKKQRKAKASYLELFRSHNLKVVELDNILRIYFNRKDKDLGRLIAHLYKEIFESADTDIVNFTATLLKADIKQLHHITAPNIKINDDYTFEATSSKYEGKSVSRVQTERILGAVYFLLYPPIIILSYKFLGLMGMCWTALIFFLFFAIYNPIYKNTSILDSCVKGSILYCILLSATLATQNIVFLQSIPSIIGVSTAVMAGALALGFAPKSKQNILQKKRNASEFRFIQIFWVIGGLGLFVTSEWARRSLGVESWVSFFGFVRIELMIAMVIIFTPAYALLLHSRKTANNE
jgi:succinate dehydrogenase flavin-adding protein (antitoxin of CptAB toxin-antitoxin module)